ncbi:uncharacterized protein EV154DRAFT_514362 [Mucor mucedo]|uniref:uncharacterized protein n=1 Tax=Mucor mucedo TaxID=29922 RepID=UPI002220AF04|nr:uncharacterized protein EV154DRAFT_514362 [Mucor mucedo]KAI7889480.1 hypothetical protein EV154DRAFT_514362 [Mucor mucedo]
MKLCLIVSLLFLTATKPTLSQSVQARYDPACGYLSDKIYCFGGLTTAGTSFPDSTMVMLDIVNGSGSTLDELKDQWVTVTTFPNGLDITTRAYTQSMQLSDGKTLLISGGWNNDYTNLAVQTLAFNAEDLGWRGFANYTEYPYGDRQIYYASSVYVPNYGVGYYGGIETNYNASWSYPGINVSQYQDETEQLRYIGYTGLTFFNIDQPENPWSVYPNQLDKPNVFSMYQRSIFDSKSNSIFFFGGIYQTSSLNNTFDYTFESSVLFNLTKGQWGTQGFTGSGPSPRYGHTATLVGPNQRDVLIYGGTNNKNNNRALLDFCFTLNLDTYQWTQQNIVSSPNVVLIRTDHSALVISHETVFMVFGKDSSDSPTLSVVVLNVTNPTNVTLVDRYIDPKGSLIPRITNSKGSETGLSTGAIAGIAVGATAAGLLGIGAIIFFILRKKRAEKKKREALEAEKQKDQQIEEPTHVNWVELEKYADAMSPTSLPSQFTYSPRLNDDSTTIVSSSPIVNKPSPMLIQQGLDYQRPNAIDEEGPSGVARYPSLQKPDGA